MKVLRVYNGNAAAVPSSRHKFRPRFPKEMRGSELCASEGRGVLATSASVTGKSAHFERAAMDFASAYELHRRAGEEGCRDEFDGREGV